MTNLDHALAHARAGFSVFPLSDNAKDPRAGFDRWQYRATTDEAQIRTWWAKWPEANIAIYTGGLLVVDVDPRNGGHDTIEALRLSEDFPKTRRAKTRSGGDHIYYSLPPGTLLSGRAHMMGAGLDVKTYGGYVVAPGSSVDGKPYTWGNDRPIAQAPQWMIDRCKQPRPKSPVAGKRVVEEDEWATDAAWSFAQNFKTAPAGERNDACVVLANRFFDFGLELATAIEYVTMWSEHKCDPPMDAGEIAITVESAMRSRQNSIGCAHREAPGFEAVDIDEAKAPAKALELPAEQRPKGLYYLDFKDGAARALTHNAEPLVHGLIDCETMSVVYGESNSGKSFSEMDKDFRISIGEPVAGRPVKQGAVVWVAAEGGSGVYKRLAALKAHYKRDDAPFFIVPCPVDLRRADADVKPLIALIKQIETERGVKVVKITVDTLSRVMAGGDENSPVDMGLLVHHFDAIRYVAKAHVAIIHHTGKDKAKGARGHSLLRAATDTEIEVNDKVITVTKQRDLEGDTVFRFALKPIHIGTDNRGNQVTSCYVEIEPRTRVAAEPLPMSSELEEFLEEICDSVREEYDTNEETLYTQAFSTKFAVECASRLTTENARVHSEKPKAFRETIRRHMHAMHENARIRKGKRSQWFIVDARNAQNIHK